MMDNQEGPRIVCFWPPVDSGTHWTAVHINHFTLGTKGLSVFASDAHSLIKWCGY